MKKIFMAGLAVSSLALCMVGCLPERLVERSADADGPDRIAVAARIPIGSTEPLTLCSTLTQLRNMSTSGNYKLTRNIDASSTANSPFVPIGFTKDPFHGTFDGGNFTIDKLTINGSGDNTGMFSWAVHADLKNIRLTNVNVTGRLNTGAIAGVARNLDLTNSYVTGTVTGSTQGEAKVGMVFGSAGDFVRISRCYATGTVKGWARHIGGFIGYVGAYGIQDPNEDFRMSMQEVFTNVTVTPNMPGSGSVYAGGLVGYVIGGDFQNVHTVGPVTGRNAVGGLLGYVVNDDPNSDGTIVRGAMSRGVVTDNAIPQRAGTIGMSTGTFSRCESFWDTGTDTGIPNPGMPEPQCQAGRSSDDLKAAHLTPAPKLLLPYIYGDTVDQAFLSEFNLPPCYLGSGSDGDWGFGTCGDTPIWAANSNTQYNTLLRIPNPNVQPR